jgi:hypothetical protein
MGGSRPALRVVELPGFVNQHAWDALSNRKCKPIDPTAELALEGHAIAAHSTAPVPECALADRANENIKQSGFHERCPAAK